MVASWRARFVDQLTLNASAQCLGALGRVAPGVGHNASDGFCRAARVRVGQSPGHVATPPTPLAPRGHPAWMSIATAADESANSYDCVPHLEVTRASRVRPSRYPTATMSSPGRRSCSCRGVVPGWRRTRHRSCRSPRWSAVDGASRGRGQRTGRGLGGDHWSWRPVRLGAVLAPIPGSPIPVRAIAGAVTSRKYSIGALHMFRDGGHVAQLPAR